jgi:hypothetical protein
MKRHLLGPRTLGFFAAVTVLIFSAVPSHAWSRGGWGNGGSWHGGGWGSGSWHSGFHPSVVVNNRVFVSNRVVVSDRVFVNNRVVVVQRPCCFRPHVFFGVGVAVPVWYPAYAYAGPVYSPPVVVESTPPVYTQQAPPPPPQYWYYCQSPQGYYPYVKECPGGWLQVVPQPTPPPQ